MLNSPIIEVAIGMVFIFTLLSILVTQINTFVLNSLNLRAKQLKEGLMQLVTDSELQAKILAHPLIRMVPDTVNPGDKLGIQKLTSILNMNATNVTYIAPSTFVEAVLSILTADADSSMFKQLEDAIAALPNNDNKVRLRELMRDLRGFGTTDTRTMRAAIMELPNETHRQVLSYALESVEDSFGRIPIKSGQLIPLMEGIRRIKDPAFKQAVTTVLVTARNLPEARQKMENWFNDGMGRVSELYKRKVGYLSLVVGLIVAILLNADTFQLASSFWEDPVMRQTVVAAAKRGVNEVEKEVKALVTPTPFVTSQTVLPTPVPETLPDGAVTGDVAVVPTSEALAVASEQQKVESQVNAEAAADQSAQQISDTVQKLIDLQLPLGWEFTPITPELLATSQLAGLSDPRTNLRNLWNFGPLNNEGWVTMLGRKILGWVVTALAVAQGASFWFDILRRLATGKLFAPGSVSPTVTVNMPPQFNTGYPDGQNTNAGAQSAGTPPQLPF